MSWVYLFIAGFFEVVWAIGMKLSLGFTRPLESGVTIIAMLLSFGFLVLAVRDLPIGTAYAIWTGLGAVGVALLGMMYLGEPVSAMRLVCISAIILGIVGLKMTAST